MSLSIHPTERGYYWATHDGERHLVFLFRSDNEWRVEVPGNANNFPAGEFTDWGGMILDPREPKPKKRAAIVDISFEAVARCLNLPEGIDVAKMQVDLFRQTLRLMLVGPGLTAAHELLEVEAEHLKSAPICTRVVEIDGRAVQVIESVGLGA